jgi:serine/threonine-protein kinase RsbW
MHKRPPLVVVDNNDELRSALERALRSRSQVVIARREDETDLSDARERGSAARNNEVISGEHPDKITRSFIELPSDLALLEPIADYITDRVEQAWSVPADRCLSLAIALREALANAIKHGNRSDPAKLVRITAEVSRHKAKFTVEDEGDGFDVNAVPPPRDPDNLLKSSGRGVLLIRSVMDDARYNDRGNRLTMIKRRTSMLKHEPMSRPPS